MNADSQNGTGKHVRHPHKWGFQDTSLVLLPDNTVQMVGDRYNLSGAIMPEFMPFVQDMLGVEIDPKDIKQERRDKPVDPPNINQAFYAEVQQKFPTTRYTLDNQQRLLHSHGQTSASEIYQVMYGKLDRAVDMVFFCETEEDAVTLTMLAQQHNVCLVPYGGGTNVSGALMLPQNEARMIVSVDMLRMNKIEWIDEENLRACVQAGITGKVLEEELAKKGFVCGHEPDSVELSTLGGWIATNASGMKKNRYGNIEEIVENVTLVTPKGILQQIEATPRVSMGMQPLKLLYGNEGNLGLITSAVIRIHRPPEVKQYGSIVFPDFKTGVAFMYDLTHSGVMPASVRLVDNFQFRFGSALRPRATGSEAFMRKIQKYVLLNVKKFDPNQICIATVVMEGSQSEVKHQAAEVARLVKKHGGMAGGAGHGQRGYMLTYAIAYIRDFLFQYHVIGETFETTVPWSKIHDVIGAVTKEVGSQHKQYNLPGKSYISARVTQCYHTGVCIYFTYGFSVKGVANPEAIFHDIEHQLRQVILDTGGSISHHHGVGKLRKDFMARTLSPTSIELLKQTKQAVDPQNIFGIRNNIFME